MAINLFQHIHDLQILENQAADKIAEGVLTIEQDKLLVRDEKARMKYIKKFVRDLEAYIFPEVVKAAKEGVELNKEIKSGGK